MALGSPTNEGESEAKDIRQRGRMNLSQRLSTLVGHLSRTSGRCGRIPFHHHQSNVRSLNEQTNKKDETKSKAGMRKAKAVEEESADLDRTISPAVPVPSASPRDFSKWDDGRKEDDRACSVQGKDPTKHRSARLNQLDTCRNHRPDETSRTHLALPIVHRWR